MTKTIRGLALGFMMLFAVLPQMGIIAVVKAATGWKMPKWLAIVIAGLGCAAAVASALATFGVTVPAAVLKICAVTKSVTA